MTHPTPQGQLPPRIVALLREIAADSGWQGADGLPLQDDAKAALAATESLMAEVEALRKDAARWKAVEQAGGELTLRLHNSRSDQRASVIDAALSQQSGSEVKT